MKQALQHWWDHMEVLTVDTVRTWWRCLPALLSGLTIGLLGYHSLLVLAAFISGDHPWLSVVVLSLGFASMLVGYLFCLRVLGRDLAVGERLLQTQQGESLVDEPLTKLVSVALLPFIGIYAVFGRIQETSGQLVTYEVITRGMFERGVLSTLNPRTVHDMWVILGVLLGAFVLRRSLDFAHERTGRRVFGILTGLVETFFTLVLIYGGTRMINTFSDWVMDRRIAEWVRTAVGRVADFWALIDVRIPQWISQCWDLVLGPGWRWFSAGLGEPLLWLAMAALAFGSRAMSATELWRESVGGRPTPIGKLSDGLATPGVQKVWTETKELFFGDLDDKWLPTLQSLRLVLSAGISLIGVFCLLHAGAMLVDEGTNALLHGLVGPRESRVWVALGVFQDLLTSLVSEPLRLSLLAVTYVRCLQLLQAHAEEEIDG